MDVIASLGFGMEIDSQTNPDNTFVKYAKELFTVKFTPLLILAGKGFIIIFVSCIKEAGWITNYPSDLPESRS